jgi:hypothetical protein
MDRYRYRCRYRYIGMECHRFDWDEEGVRDGLG